jgi:hypothetical protein
MSHEMKEEPFLRMGTAEVIPRHVHYENFKDGFLDRNKREDEFYSNRNGGLIKYTDCTKMIEGGGSGIYGSGTSTLSNTPGGMCSRECGCRLQNRNAYILTIMLCLKHLTITISIQN